MPEFARRWWSPPLRLFQQYNLGSPLTIGGWALVSWIVLFWDRGYPSFWDPDEAQYAQVTREMLASGDWLVPRYNGEPFFDKPVLFYWLQMITFQLLGPAELAARMVPALSALGLFACTAWFGRALFDSGVGRSSALMLAVLPATFALSAYAILDLTFTLFLFGGTGLVTYAALADRPNLQYTGYVVLAAAVLTKGPLALALSGIAFLISLAIAPEARGPLLRLRWGIGLSIIIGLSAPWFVYMWWRFGHQFVEGYLLRENLWLYVRPLYDRQPSYFFYSQVVAVGLLPWTPLLVGRLIDVLRGSRMETAERLLWAWTLAVVGFFSLSHFRLDHYVYPAAPALCLLCAHAWVSAYRAERISWGVSGAAMTVSIALIAAGVILIPGLERAPLELSAWKYVVPAAFVGAGILGLAQMCVQRFRPPSMPVLPAAGLLVAFAVVILVAFPSFEQAKPVRGLARRVAAVAQPGDHVAMYRLNRWSSSYRFYVGRHTAVLDTPEDLWRFFATPGRHYCAMLQRDFQALGGRGLALKVVDEQPGLFVTTGRALRGGRAARRERFVVVSDAQGAEPTVTR